MNQPEAAAAVAAAAEVRVGEEGEEGAWPWLAARRNWVCRRGRRSVADGWACPAAWKVIVDAAGISWAEAMWGNFQTTNGRRSADAGRRSGAVSITGCKCNVNVVLINESVI